MQRSRLLLLFLLLAGAQNGWGQTVFVTPYIQPGNVAGLSKEEKVLIWQTDSVPAQFKVEYLLGNTFEGPGKVVVAKAKAVPVAGYHNTLLYRATLSGLAFDTIYTYRVSLGAKVIGEATFRTRTRKPSTHFVVFGDCGAGTKEQRAIAYQVARQDPQFVLIVGDNVYNDGLMSEYHRRFFSVYLSTSASPEHGAPLMKTTPFYMLVGNHDVGGSDFDKKPDGLAFFYFVDLPLNAPVAELNAKPKGDPKKVKAFQKAAGRRFPRLANYSFEYGNVHITCLDASDYANPLDPAILQWMKDDISASKAEWKFVSFHQPGFNSSKSHYNDQIMRLLAPIFESLKVDMVLAGHVHNYQRTVPLKFRPKMNAAGDQYVISKEGLIDGTFTLDQKFDGSSNLHPDGIIYIVSGGGGAKLYDPEMSNKPELWKHDPPDNWAPFTKKLISDTHSFTVIDTNGKKLKLTQIDQNGNVIDTIQVAK